MKKAKIIGIILCGALSLCIISLLIVNFTIGFKEKAQALESDTQLKSIPDPSGPTNPQINSSLTTLYGLLSPNTQKIKCDTAIALTGVGVYLFQWNFEFTFDISTQTFLIYYYQPNTFDRITLIFPTDISEGPQSMTVRAGIIANANTHSSEYQPSIMMNVSLENLGYTTNDSLPNISSTILIDVSLVGIGSDAVLDFSLYDLNSAKLYHYQLGVTLENFSGSSYRVAGYYTQVFTENSYRIVITNSYRLYNGTFYSNIRTELDKMYRLGNSDGIYKGYNAGNTDGYNAGYADGYNAGIQVNPVPAGRELEAAQQTATTLFNSVFETLNIKLFGFISVADILTIVVVCGIVLLILRFVRS